MKPRIFLGSSGKQAKLVQALTRGLADRLESADRASGYWITGSATDVQLRERTSGVYLRADPDDMIVLDGDDAASRAELLATRLSQWKSIVNT